MTIDPPNVMPTWDMLKGSIKPKRSMMYFSDLFPVQPVEVERVHKVIVSSSSIVWNSFERQISVEYYGVSCPTRERAGLMLCPIASVAIKLFMTSIAGSLKKRDSIFID